MFFDFAAFTPLLKHLKHVIFCILVTLFQEMAIYRNVNTSIMYLFSLAAITNYHTQINYHKSSGLKQSRFIILLFWRLKVWCSSHRANIKAMVGLHSSSGYISLTFPFSKAHLNFLAHNSFHFQSQQCCISLIIHPWSHLPLTLLILLFSTFKDLVITLGWPC